MKNIFKLFSFHRGGKFNGKLDFENWLNFKSSEEENK